MKKVNSLYEAFASQKGLLENSLGQYGKDVLYDNEYKMAKRILIKGYGYIDVEEFFPDYVDQERYKDTLDRLFTYYAHNDETKEGLTE